MSIVVPAMQKALLVSYSDKSQNPAKGLHNEVTYCTVRVDGKTGSRYFYFRFRRYIYDAASNKFIPGCWNVQQDTAIREWLDTTYLYQGLSKDEAVKRLGTVGPNVLDLKKPTIVSSIIHEFSKPFYLYQNFLVWTWGKLMRELFATFLISGTHSQIHRDVQRHSGTITCSLSIASFDSVAALSLQYLST